MSEVKYVHTVKDENGFSVSIDGLTLRVTKQLQCHLTSDSASADVPSEGVLYLGDLRDLKKIVPEALRIIEEEYGEIS